MNDIVFDKLTYLDRLRSSGFSEEQARAHAEALYGALHESVATKGDITAVRHELETAVAEIKGELKLNRWMLALVIAVTVIPFVRDLF